MKDKSRREPEMTSTRRPLTQQDLLRMKVPTRLWNVTLAGVRANTERAPLRDLLVKYVSGADSMVASGYGMLLWGDNGRGKSGAAAAVVMELRRRGHTVLFLEAAKLKDYVIRNVEFDMDESVWERAQHVDVLVIDDLGKGTLDSKGFGERLLDELVRSRSANMRATFITSNMSPKRLLETGTLKKSTVESLKACTLPVKVSGDDLREQEQNELRAAMLG